VIVIIIIVIIKAGIGNIATGCGLDGQGIGVQFPAGARDFPLLHFV
jgi:hypothetical protein